MVKYSYYATVTEKYCLEGSKRRYSRPAANAAASRRRSIRQEMLPRHARRRRQSTPAACRHTSVNRHDVIAAALRRHQSPWFTEDVRR